MSLDHIVIFPLSTSCYCLATGRNMRFKAARELSHFEGNQLEPMRQGFVVTMPKRRDPKDGSAAQQRATRRAETRRLSQITRIVQPPGPARKGVRAHAYRLRVLGSPAAALRGRRTCLSHGGNIHVLYDMMTNALLQSLTLISSQRA